LKTCCSINASPIPPAICAKSLPTHNRQYRVGADQRRGWRHCWCNKFVRCLATEAGKLRQGLRKIRKQKTLFEWQFTYSGNTLMANNTAPVTESAPVNNVPPAYQVPPPDPLPANPTAGERKLRLCQIMRSNDASTCALSPANLVKPQAWPA